MRSGWLQCVAMAACALLLASCGSSSKSAFVYLASQGTSPGIVTAYKVDLRSGVLNSSNGALVQTGNAVKAGTQPTVLLFDPTSSFAYAANFGSNDISLFTVNKDGSLAAASGTAALTNAARPSALAIDPGAHFLFVANQGLAATLTNPVAIPGNVSVFAIGSGGALTEVAGSPFGIQETSPPLQFNPIAPFPSGVAVSHQGNFVYVSDQANNAVVSFSFDSTSGALTPIAEGCAQCFGVNVGTGPTALLSPPAGNFLYVANSSSNNIFEFAIDPNDGTLSPIQANTTTVPTGVGPIAMTTDPAAKYFYALANGGSQVIGYTLNQVTGQLTAISGTGGTVVSTGANPVAFTLRSDGSLDGNFWLFVSNNGGSTISTYSMQGTTGKLTALPQLTSPLAPYGIGSR
jgi:6-phosphogluconolactonase (cycloisomerase 2 family)